MACKSCSAKKALLRKEAIYDVLGGRDYLPAKQIRARLDIFKKRHCVDCSIRYSCDYQVYLNCTVKPTRG